MPCNIDAKGKAVRLICGIIALLIGIVLIALRQFDVLPDPLWLYAGIASALVGKFCILEGWAGWCALRALGFKTPL